MATCHLFLAAGWIRDNPLGRYHKLLLRAGINPAPTTNISIGLVGAGFTPAL
jgi:hypothetical protein